MSFTHLHLHTEYSLLDGSNKIRECISRVRELGMDSVAITDHGCMFGVMDFYKCAKAQGIKPILGCEVYVSPGSRFDKESGSGADDRYYHLVLLAENDEGYHHLMKIVSRGYTEGYYYKPRVDKELLEKYSSGLIALSACLAGEVQKNLQRGLYDEARKAAIEYRRIFGDNDFFLELQDHGFDEQKKVNQELMRLSEETGISLVATNDVHYTYAEDERPHDILLCIQTGKKLSDEGRMRYPGGQFYIKSEEEMRRIFPYAPEAIENTHRIAERCHVDIRFGETKLPKFDVPQGKTAWEYLKVLCERGLRERYDPVTEELTERLAYELSVIRSMGYVDYFLIVWDFIKYAKDHGIIVGPGRGSAAGSLVSYCLDITTIDPIRFHLLFERFLNPERVSMPDIDVDFCFERRQEVLDYVVEKYGHDRVVQIATFGTMAARGVIRDVGRVMELPYAFVDVIAKLVPQELNITLEKALKTSRELRRMYEEDERVKELIDMSRRLEGLPRHTSTHAAGVVISQKAVDEYVPLSLGTDNTVTTQFTMTTLEELGLLKMDFLGLRTLTVIQEAVKMAEARSGKKIDFTAMNFDDMKVFDLIGSGRTDGIFQLESAGMKSFMKELKPRNLEDIIAGISLYRPGPMDFIPQYVRGKNHRDSISYDCRELEPILAPTYGCIVYQEQVMQIVRDLAGYTLGRSDLLRRAMSKKKGDVMEKERKNFVYGNPEENVPGCVARGIPENVAHKIYDEMIDFAKYAFNKSHAAAYAVISYETAWLKCYYPMEFMAALMTSVMDNTAKVSEYIYSCREMGITVLPPDINQGDKGFSVDGGGIRYGLAAIKSVGRPVIEAILRQRNENGRFRDIEDFIKRLSGREVNKRTVEGFIKAGAFDSLGGTRKQYMIVYDRLIESVSRSRKKDMEGQVSLFDIMPGNENPPPFLKLPNVGEYSDEDKLAMEKEVLGIYVSGHPLEKYRELWKRTISKTTADFQPGENGAEKKVRDGNTEVVGGIITARTIKYTKNNKTMCFLTLEDLLGTVDVVVFPDTYGKFAHDLEEDAKVFIRGRVSEGDDSPSQLICERVKLFEQNRREVWLQFPDKKTFFSGEKDILDIIRDSEGDDELVVYCVAERAVKRYDESYNVNGDSVLLGRLKNYLGDKNVKLMEKPIVMS